MPPANHSTDARLAVAESEIAALKAGMAQMMCTIERMAGDIHKLTLIAERGKGIVWAVVLISGGIGSALGALIPWALSHLKP